MFVIASGKCRTVTKSIKELNKPAEELLIV